MHHELEIRTNKRKERDVAQLVAHTSGGREVASSSLVIPTFEGVGKLPAPSFFPISISWVLFLGTMQQNFVPRKTMLPLFLTQFFGRFVDVLLPIGTSGSDAAIWCNQNKVRQIPDSPLLHKGTGES